MVDGNENDVLVQKVVGCELILSTDLKGTGKYKHDHRIRLSGVQLQHYILYIVIVLQNYTKSDYLTIFNLY